MENSLRQQVIAMEKGDQLTIPVTAKGYTTVRTYASDLGYLYARKYSVSRNEDRSFTITRTL